MLKISGLEKGVLALTLAFLLAAVGYYFVEQGGSEPYRVSAQTVGVWEISAAEQVREQETAVSVERVNINTATQAQLQSLPGIGQARAEAIIADREANGPFHIPEDITRVSGIGQGILEGILDYITVE